jgi:hypothetical protein
MGPYAYLSFPLMARRGIARLERAGAISGADRASQRWPRSAAGDTDVELANNGLGTRTTLTFLS